MTPGRRLARRGMVGVAIALVCSAASAQTNPTSWWPKHQGGLGNTGQAPALAIATDAHVLWSLQVGQPVQSELHASPALSADNSRLYCGGQASVLTAVDLDARTIVWTLTLGDGTGLIHQTPTIGADGSIYVGSWDNAAPYDGFCKVRDLGASGEIAWSYPLQLGLSSPVIADDGLIIVCGQHATTGWGIYALRDLGDLYQQVWAVPTAPIGGTPAVTPDGRWLIAGSDSDHKLWQIDLMDGRVQSSIVLTNYVWCAGPAISDDGYIFIGEGMSYGSPNPATQGKVYAFNLDANAQLVQVESLALRVGHLNGGIGALRRDPVSGLLRLYVPANGTGSASASLVSVQFDPAGPTATPPRAALTKRWTRTIGGLGFTYPSAVVTEDAGIYTVGPVDHVLYAVRDAGAASKLLWSLPITSITRVMNWTPGNLRGDKEIIATPDGLLYWRAIDGYLYALTGWPTGDLDADEDVDNDDVELLRALVAPPDTDSAVTARDLYDWLFPEVDLAAVGDVNGDGLITSADLERLEALVGP
jgi:outer membrane protein assembly factor BamB